MIPIITMLALDLAAIISGSVVIERVFDWHGVGWLLVRSAQSRDLPVLIAIIMIVCLVVIVANWLADILYSVVDPRVRLRRSKVR